MTKELRKYAGRLVGSLLLFLVVYPALSQISSPGKPYPLSYPGCPDLIVYDFVIEYNKSAIHDTGMLKNANAGQLLEVEFNPDNTGIWDTLADGTKLWRIALHVEGAEALDLILAPYKLYEGSKLYIYDRQQIHVRGAFTEKNNKSFNLLATSQIPGDFIILELQVPATASSYGLLGISGIGCDLKQQNSMKSVSDEWYGKSGPCNVNINCITDGLIQQLKYAVVRIIFNGTERCTGTLVNTTRHDGIDYILTAGHCFTNRDGKADEKNANTAVFYFDYESPFCSGHDGYENNTLSGSTIRAFSSDLDFALLELFEPIPYSYHPYYAGWDHSSNIVNSGFAIHHPLGDVKKVSIENHPLPVSSFTGYDRNTHMLVRHWESGTTENGSSGAAFFNSNGQIIGTLTGGAANCVNPVNDYFAMFSHSWKDYANTSNQLAFWLDPLNLRTKSLDGYDPYQEFWNSGDTLKNILPGDTLKQETGDLEWGNYGGYNSEYLKGFADHFSIPVSKRVLGVILEVDQSNLSTEGSIWVKLWKNFEPEAILYEREIGLDELLPGELTYVEFHQAVDVGNDFFAGVELNFDLAFDSVIFSVAMAQSRLNDSYNTAWVKKGNPSTWISLAEHTGNTINSSFAIYPVVYDSIPQQTDPVQTGEINVYPNPASDKVLLFFNELTQSSVDVSIYNMAGQKVLNQSYGSYQHVIPVNVNNLSSGIYLVQTRYEGKNRFLKLAIVK